MYFQSDYFLFDYWDFDYWDFDFEKEDFTRNGNLWFKFIKEHCRGFIESNLKRYTLALSVPNTPGDVITFNNVKSIKYIINIYKLYNEDWKNYLHVLYDGNNNIPINQI